MGLLRFKARDRHEGVGKGGIGEKGVKEYFVLRCPVQLYLSLDLRERSTVTHKILVICTRNKRKLMTSPVCLVTGASLLICLGLTRVFNL
jgi:hypothetical protein